MSNDVLCAQCNGTGTMMVFVDGWDVSVICGECFGDGVVTPKRAEWIRKGTDHRVARVNRGESLHQCAERYHISIRHLVNMEHARTEPNFPP